MATTITTTEARERAAAKIVADTEAGQTPPRKLYMNGYSKREIARKLAKAPGGMLYGGTQAANFVPQAPVQSRPGFYKDNRKNSFVDTGEEEATAPTTEEKAKLTLNIIELMTANQKLSKSAAIEQLDALRPGHGLEAQNKAVVVAALTQAQIEDAEK